MPYTIKIRQQLKSYMRMPWETYRIENLDPLINLMTECIIQGINSQKIKLDDLQNSVIDKMAKILAPMEYLALLPAHTILKAEPLAAKQDFSRYETFYLNSIPNRMEQMGIEVVCFHPVTDFRLFKIKQSHLIHAVLF